MHSPIHGPDPRHSHQGSPLNEFECSLQPGIRGQTIVEGIGIGTCFAIDLSGEVAKRFIEPSLIDQEIIRFQQALIDSKAEYARESSKGEVGNTKAAANILESTVMLLDDPEVNGQTIRAIRDHAFAAEYAYAQSINHFIRLLKTLPGMMGERANDFKAVGKHVISKLQGNKTLTAILSEIEYPVVLIGEVPPEAILAVKPPLLEGIVLVDSSRESHAAIMAASRNIPCLSVCSVLSSSSGSPHASGEIVRQGQLVEIRCHTEFGSLIHNPSLEAVALHREVKQKDWQQRQIQHAPLLLQTRDGVQVEIKGNINTPEDLDSVLLQGATGVGLFRTETWFLLKGRIVEEEEQFRAYQSIVEKVAGKGSCTIRTLDISEDKINDTFRALLGRDHSGSIDEPLKALICPQVRAMIRASVHGELNILIPMINDADEFLSWQSLVASEKHALGMHTTFKLGALIETAAGADQAEAIAKNADFIAIGTNDLASSSLGLSRLTHAADTQHPAVLRNIERIVRACAAQGKPVHVCGMMASNVDDIPLLLGLGVTSLSSEGGRMLKIAERIQSSVVSACTALVSEMLVSSPSQAKEIFARFKHEVAFS